VEPAVKITGQIISVARLLDKVGDTILSDFRISMGAFEIMALIKAGDATTSELARRTESTPSNITHMTKVLEDRGFITRSVDSKDKRVWRFVISEDGESLMATVQSFYDDAVSLLFSQFTDVQRNDVSDFLKATQEHLEMVVDNKEHVKEMVKMIKGRTFGAGQ
jgi:DNA-binding MarR family transcriptional regulator